MSGATPVRGGALATYGRLLRYARRYWAFALMAVLGMVFDAAATALFT